MTDLPAPAGPERSANAAETEDPHSNAIPIPTRIVDETLSMFVAANPAPLGDMDALRAVLLSQGKVSAEAILAALEPREPQHEAP